MTVAPGGNESIEHLVERSLLSEGQLHTVYLPYYLGVEL